MVTSKIDHNERLIKFYEGVVVYSLQTFTCSKSKIAALEKGPISYLRIFGNQPAITCLMSKMATPEQYLEFI